MYIKKKWYPVRFVLDNNVSSRKVESKLKSITGNSLYSIVRFKKKNCDKNNETTYVYVPQINVYSDSFILDFDFDS